MKIASWNVNSLRVRLPQVLDWLQSAQPDVLAIQETKLTDDNFPAAELKDAGYHVVFSGQPTYNGVALLSKAPMQTDATDIPGLADPQRRVLGALINDVYVLNLYVPNGQSVDSDKYRYKLDWLAKLAAWTAKLQKQHKQLVLLGDFNIAPEDRDVHDPEEWRDQVLCSVPERKALQALLDTGLYDTFRLFEQAEQTFSWWDYRAAGFRRNRGLRIDLILASTALRDVCKTSAVDREPRTWERPSDHAPVIAEFTGR